jgi:hypothetical protein
MEDEDTYEKRNKRFYLEKYFRMCQRRNRSAFKAVKVSQAAESCRESRGGVNAEER